MPVAERDGSSAVAVERPFRALAFGGTRSDCYGECSPHNNDLCPWYWGLAHSSVADAYAREQLRAKSGSPPRNTDHRHHRHWHNPRIPSCKSRCSVTPWHGISIGWEFAAVRCYRRLAPASPDKSRWTNLGIRRVWLLHCCCYLWRAHSYWRSWHAC